MSKNRLKNTNRTQPGPRAVRRVIDRVLEGTGKTIAQLANAAADWWKQYGRRIHNREVTQVVARYSKKKFKPPKWLMRFLKEGPYASYVAA